jgi:hypothetical protein
MKMDFSKFRFDVQTPWALSPPMVAVNVPSIRGVPRSLVDL